jgi:hypothetical protein
MPAKHKFPVRKDDRRAQRTDGIIGAGRWRVLVHPRARALDVHASRLTREPLMSYDMIERAMHSHVARVALKARLSL